MMQIATMGSCRPKCEAGCCRLGPQNRAAIISATQGALNFSKVAEKLRSQWSKADLQAFDKSTKGREDKAFGTGFDGSEDDPEGNPEVLPEKLDNDDDGAYGDDGIHYST